MKKSAFLYPGQGAQAVGMGKDFFEKYAEAREVYEWGESILHEKISDTIFSGPESKLILTRNCQIALFLTSLAITAVLRKEFPTLKAHFFAGLSLGEYTALIASGKARFEELLPLVSLRGEYMEEACRKNQGKMAAILGLSSEKVEEAVRNTDLPHEIWVANYNTPLQTVISGTAKGVERASQIALEMGAKRAIPLAVDGAFHSGHMREAEEKLQGALREIKIDENESELVMNKTGGIVSNKDEIRKELSRQMSSSVRWHQGIQKMISENVELFLEIGPGKVLAGFNRQIGQVPTVSINQLSDLESVAKYL